MSRRRLGATSPKIKTELKLSAPGSFGCIAAASVSWKHDAPVDEVDFLEMVNGVLVQESINHIQPASSGSTAASTPPVPVGDTFFFTATLLSSGTPVGTVTSHTLTCA